MPVAGRVAIVTGGASGMGRTSALLLAANGAKLVVADRDAGNARKVKEEIAAKDGSAIDVAVDVGDSAAVSRLVERTLQDFGRVDILVHAAGICPRQPFLEMSDDDWREVQRVNLDGTFYITREVGKVMAAQRSGTMILVTSDRGVHGSVDYAHYAASKGGMIALTKSRTRPSRAPPLADGKKRWRSTCWGSTASPRRLPRWFCFSPAPPVRS
jgi:NAD(P)-dependent dehydrogenase (short-subunit alcohol dehydrogenase family)